MGVLAQNDAAAKNQAALKSTGAEASEGYEGYGKTPGVGGYQAPPKPFVSVDPNAGQPTSFWGRMAKVGEGKIAQVGITTKMIVDSHSKNPTAFRNANTQNNQNNAKITSNVTALKNSGGLPGKVATNVLQGAVHGARDVAGLPGGIVSSTKSAFKGTASGIARMLPGGMNDVKNQEQQVSNADKSTANTIALEKSGKLSKTAGNKILQQNAGNASQGTKEASATLKSMPTTKEFAGDITQVGSVLLPGAKGAEALGGEYLLKQVGEAGVKEIAEKVGVDAGKQSIEDTAEKVVQTKAGQKAAQTIAKGGKSVVTKALQSSAKNGAIFGVNNAGQAASNNESGKNIAKSGAEGFGVGALAGGGGSLLKSGVEKVTGKTAVGAKLVDMANKHQVNEKMADERGLPAGDTSKTLSKGTVTKLLPEGEKIDKNESTAVVKGKTVQSGFVRQTDKTSATASVVGSRISQLDKIVANAQKNGTAMSATELRGIMQERQSLFDVAAGKKTLADVKSTVKDPVTVDKLTQAVKKDSASNTDVERGETASVSQRVSRPSTTKAPQLKPELLPDTNRPAATGVSGLINRAANKSGLTGKFNPVDRAAAEGHTQFADTARQIAGAKEYAIRKGNLDTDKFDSLYSTDARNVGDHEQFIKNVESGNAKTEAEKNFAKISNDTGKELSNTGVTKGFKENYVGRSAEFPNKKSGLSGSGLSKGGSFAKSRETVTDEFGNSSDKYKTHAEYKAAVEANGGKVLTDPRDILRHTLPSKYEAIENARGLAKLEKTPMGDGRPAIVTVGSKGAPREFSDYHSVDGLQGRIVHPGAVNTMKALTHTYTEDEINNPARKLNSMAKRIITLNGLVHGKNFTLGSLRRQGVINTVKALANSNKDIADTYGEDNIRRAITKGGIVPYGQGKSDAFDTLSNGNEKLSNKFIAPFSTAHDKVNQVLFNKIGNHLQFSTYFNAEKGFKAQDLSDAESARLAGDVAKKVAFNSSSVESSVEYRKTSGLIAFAGQYFKSTLNEMARASGLARDNSLSSKAQSAAQKDAIKGIVRGMTILLGTANAINYATTGHSTFQNKDSKISPVFYIDKATGKEYHLSNFYGQLGDMAHLLGNPVKELSNKASPLVQETSRLLNAIASGSPDPNTGQTVINKNASGARQTGEAFGNFLENMISPAGVQLSTGGKSVPATVRAAQLFGYGASTTDQNALEKNIAQLSGASIPSGAPAPSAQMQTLEATARNDLSKGKTNSPAIQQVKSQMNSTQFKQFMKTGADNTTQREFDKLSTQQKLQIVQQYSPQQLKELDLSGLGKTLVGSNAKSVIQGLNAKGVTNQQIQQTLQKVDIGSSQLQALKAQAKAQAAQSRKASARQPKFVNPLL